MKIKVVTADYYDIPNIIKLKELLAEQSLCMAYTDILKEQDRTLAMDMYKHLSIYAVLKCHGYLQGYVSYSKVVNEAGYCYYIKIGIMKKFQHKGYGKLLLNYLLTLLKTLRKHSTLYAFIDENNVIALNLFKKFNFVLIPADKHESILMLKNTDLTN